jgi:hypothetical protein
METKVGYLTKILFKLYIHLKDKFDVTPKPSEEEKYIIEICKKLIRKESSQLFLAPISRKRYIINDEHSIFCTISMGAINMVHNYHFYNIYPEGGNAFKDLVESFDKEAESRRNTMESKINNTIKIGLKELIEKL